MAIYFDALVVMTREPADTTIVSSTVSLGLGFARCVEGGKFLRARGLVKWQRAAC